MRKATVVAVLLLLGGCAYEPGSLGHYLSTGQGSIYDYYMTGPGKYQEIPNLSANPIWRGITNVRSYSHTIETKDGTIRAFSVCGRYSCRTTIKERCG